ncbi:MAG: C10 family peptidase, partial [Paludibacteraceae bacterium]|nr:C10 family peptidase [Paludibacteraceae bacterium]
MKKHLTLLVALSMATMLFAERITQEDAALVANNFMNVTVSQPGMKTATARKMVLKKAATQSQNEYFVYEGQNGNGWVMVAANDVARPIIAYSPTGQFQTENQPSNLKKWLGKYDEQIRLAEAKSLEASEEVKTEWKALRAGQRTATAAVVVAPLIKTTWDQDAPYWNNCPKNCYVGCVATAMAQVMNYWQWPKQGTGSHSIKYNGTTYTANFGATTYDWDNMVDHYTSYYNASGTSVSVSSTTTAQKNAVATLMYHCGVAVDMEYSTEGSGAMTIDYNGYFSGQGEMCAETALTQFFGYKSSTVKGYYRDGSSEDGMKSWTEAEWLAMLKEELDNARPIMYAGGDQAGESGHSFVCDGYDSSNKFHFNWGWSGWCDGYYDVNNLVTADASGSGAGNGDYSYMQDVIVGIIPDKPETPVTSITLAPTTLTLKINEKQTLTPTVLPSTAEQTVAWTSSNTAVATVTNGVVKGIAKGNATITAAATDESGITATCSITVTDEVLAVAEDVIDYAFVGISGSSYGDWSEKTGESGAVYAGNSAGGNTSIQLRSTNSNSGIVTTTSAGKVSSIKVTFNSNTASARILSIYGSNTAYTAASNLYSSSTQGTLIASVAFADGAEQTIDVAAKGEYAYFGVRSSSGAMYLDQLLIEWDTTDSEGGEGGGEETPEYYLVGYWDSADQSASDANKFTEGKLDYTFTTDAYIFITTADNKNYNTATYISSGTTATFAQGNSEKMYVPAGTYTFTLVENTDGSLTLSYVVKSDEGGEGGSTSDSDIINNANTVNATTTQYAEWTYTGASGAEYAGNSAGGNGSVQLRSNNSNSGIVVTKSAGNVSSIKVTFNSNTTAGRVLSIYGSNTAYTAASELYNSSTQGTLIQEVAFDDGSVQIVTVDDEYAY